jgi:predicted metal-dependent hydrolase
LRARAKFELPARLLELAAENKLRVARVSVRNQRWRWGSCAPNGHICLNWRLVQMPPEIRDYVMIHELMHLKRMDHSSRFWRLVAQACPTYQNARKWLREHAPHGTPLAID